MAVKGSKNKGFTLIELMIAVAIAGILVGVGYPAYQNVIKESYRKSAQADLMAFAAAMERHHTGNFSYAGAAASGSDTGSPEVFSSWSPASEDAANKRYNLTIEAANGVAYELRATPVSGSSQASDGILVYFSDGRKGWDENNSGSVESSEFCWSC
ncbi:type IV pilin protein [Alteromonas confluentis]|uniref:Prepilin-type N-terminal cleavage/methylation domain-containing protein n=1 Tax=Alteromonas confluentis TaxID=1656094 RepID=A0A1E7Z7K8_9ALTE|nr:type IV pilin protein [Alteromonas confluentis]OFC69523.1 prepilin-type N-terminal cleavage/methylation domain-containing protein [Alteromonas confluentis]